METPGALVVARIPVIVPVCVVKSVSGASVLKRAHSVSVMACMSKIACVSACMKMDDGPVQTGDGNGEPKRPRREILVTASVPRDAAYEARSAFRERPSRAQLRTGTHAHTHTHHVCKRSRVDLRPQKMRDNLIEI